MVQTNALEFPPAMPGPARFGNIIDQVEQANTSLRPASSFDTANMDPRAISALAQLEQAFGGPFNINSAYRDPGHNQRVGGAQYSQHMHGAAFDIDVRDMTIEQRQELIRQARAAGFTGIGVYNNSLHFDVGGDRYWGPNYRSNSLPSWAAEAVGAPVGSLPQGLPSGPVGGGAPPPRGMGRGNNEMPPMPAAGGVMAGNVFSTLPQEIVQQAQQQQAYNALADVISRPIYDFRMSGGNALGGLG